MCCAVLYCAVLCCVLSSAVLCCAVLCCAVLWWCCAVLCCGGAVLTGVVCERGRMNSSGCCAEAEAEGRSPCLTCRDDLKCCESYEHCVACCMHRFHDQAIHSPLSSPLSPLPSHLSPLSSLLSPLTSPLSPLTSPLSPLSSHLARLYSLLSPLPSPLTSLLSPLSPLSSPLSLLSPLSSLRSPLSSLVSPITSPLSPLSPLLCFDSSASFRSFIRVRHFVLCLSLSVFGVRVRVHVRVRVRARVRVLSRGPVCPQDASLLSRYRRCLHLCRTSSRSLKHGNRYRSARFKHCYWDARAAGPRRLNVSSASVSVRAARQGESCARDCAAQGLVCHEDFLMAVNTCDLLSQHFDCRVCERAAAPAVELPAFVSLEARAGARPGACLLNTDVRYVDCDGEHADAQRLCACIHAAFPTATATATAGGRAVDREAPDSDSSDSATELAVSIGGDDEVISATPNSGTRGHVPAQLPSSASMADRAGDDSRDADGDGDGDGDDLPALRRRVPSPVASVAANGNGGGRGAADLRTAPKKDS